MNVLILGSGGREAAMAWKIAQSPLLSNLFCLPGNPGTESLSKNISGNVNDKELVAKVVLDNAIDLVVVGPEDPLVNGLRDYFRERADLKDILFVGPDADGAALEGSKDKAKSFMAKYNVPTAAYGSFTAETASEAIDYLKSLKPPYVLKADGLAGGKGVVIVEQLSEAEAELKQMFSGKFGAAGATVVIEEFLSGIELSVFVLTDGKDYMILPHAKDYKRIMDGDKGLNTGGMGAVSPVPFADEEFMNKVRDRVVEPTVKGLQHEGIDYKGFIFIGLMNCDGDPYVIEYNVRMGDPETEAVMTRIDSDLLKHLVAAAKGTLSEESLVISEKAAVTIIAVSGGYPEDYEKGKKITGVEEVKEALAFHAGTSLVDGELVTNGGRVMAITANATSIEQARETAYREVAKLNYDGIFYRKDIAIDILNLL